MLEDREVIMVLGGNFNLLSVCFGIEEILIENGLVVGIKSFVGGFAEILKFNTPIIFIEILDFIQEIKLNINQSFKVSDTF